MGKEEQGKTETKIIRVENVSEKRKRNLLQAFALMMAIGLLGFVLWKALGEPWKGFFSMKGEITLDGRNQTDSTQKKQLARPTKTGTFYQGIARYEEKGKFGYMRQNGNILIEAQFDDADVKFYEEMAWVRIGKKYGFVNSETAQIEIPVEYDQVSRFEDGFATVRLGSKKGKISKSKIVYGIERPMKSIINDPYFKKIYDKAGAFQGVDEKMRAKVRHKDEGKWGFVDEQGELVIAAEYDEVSDFEDNIAWVKIDNKCGLIDPEGHTIVPIEYDEIAPKKFEESLVRVEKSNRYGFVNNSGELIVPCIYDEAGYFREGLAYVKKDNKYGFVDESGEVVIPLRYDEIQIYEKYFGFYKGKAKMRIGNRQGYVYRDGREWWFD
ncbi:MAG: WG repeat-containing protein [Cytophagales bacterium]|nr:MAG: WG repeat-containing protein [Cytophagales bacterium]